MEAFQIFKITFAGGLGLVCAYSIYELSRLLFFGIGMMLGSQKAYNDELQKLRALKDAIGTATKVAPPTA